MVFKTLIGIFLCVFVNCVMAKTLPFVANFEPNMQNEHPNFDVSDGTSSGYFTYHGILPVLQDNPYLYNPNFEVGVAEWGIYENHEDFHKFIEIFKNKEEVILTGHRHGTRVSSVFALSQIANGKGIYGVVNAKLDFVTGKGDKDLTDKRFLESFLSRSSAKVINISWGLDGCNIPQMYRVRATPPELTLEEELEDHMGYQVCEEVTPTSVYTSAVTLQHVQNIQDIRGLFQQHPERLFVLAAGNSGVDAIMENGAIHYRIGSDGQPELDKLSNVLVVGSIDNQGILEQYSNYGKSVDIGVIGLIEAARVVRHENGEIKHVYDADVGTSYSAPIASGMESLLLSADPSLTSSQVKDYLLNSNKGFVSKRYNGSNIPLLKTDNLDHHIPIADLSASYAVLKFQLFLDATHDVSILDGIYRTAQSDEDCVNAWKSTISPRTVDGVNPHYEAKFYGDRCLYFRGNSYIIDADLTTQQVTYHNFSDYGQNKFREYMTFRHFVNNLKSAQDSAIWRNGYGVTLNMYGKVGCTVADNCIDDTIMTQQQCANIFKALTGVFSDVMGNAQTIFKSYDVCSYSTDKVEVEYDAYYGGGVSVKKKGKTFEQLLTEIQSKVNELHQLWLIQKGTSSIGPNSIQYNGMWIQFDSWDGYPMNTNVLGWLFPEVFNISIYPEQCLQKYDISNFNRSFYYDYCSGEIFENW